MAVLALHPDAIADLQAIKKASPRDAAAIVVALQEMEGDPNLADNLTDHGFGASATDPYHVSKWLRYWKRGVDLWRVKSWKLERLGLRYRIIYAYVVSTREYRVLAIARRDQIDYDDERHALNQRIRTAYDEL